MINPHFDLPFRFTGGTPGGVPVQEQGTFEDVANCVEMIVRTPLGFRDDAPDFGFPELELLEQPILTKDVLELVQAQEPRAAVFISEMPDKLDVLIDRLTVEVG
jgi:hypothetical protein